MECAFENTWQIVNFVKNSKMHLKCRPIQAKSSILDEASPSGYSLQINKNTISEVVES